MPLPEGVRALLIDIEGTTTPVSFVYDILFPFARDRLEETCGRAGEDRQVAEALRLLRREYEEEKDQGQTDLPPFGNGAPYCRYLMDQDRKSTGLKNLQGLIWEEGYRSGRLQGEVFTDVPPTLAGWKAAGIRVRIFSSGSVLAQKLLFSHTEHGDLTPFFEGFHDTTTGPKKDSGSYLAIAEAFGLPAGEILFLSDLVPELDAAADAEMRTGLVVRPENTPVTSERHPTYHSFDELTDQQ